jgi:hypothetical protein|tara:strand:+ start:689 stop:994 length:306 start_codon:yes stop_codon:yes gene_type:complete
MPFKKGDVGNPLGRRAEKPFRDALMLAVKEASGSEDKQRLRKLADKLVREALDGNVTAIGMIADRLDGKPKQQTELSSDPDNPLPTVIEHIILDEPVSRDN